MQLCCGIRSTPLRSLSYRVPALRVKLNPKVSHLTTAQGYPIPLHQTRHGSSRAKSSDASSISSSSFAQAPQAFHPYHVAVVGSGPAGFYATRRLLTRLGSNNVRIDMYEQLPVPFGLVRFGVAPDHPEVKNCIDTFSEVASSPAFRFAGNVVVGTNVSLTALHNAYDAVIFSYGAAADKTLGIPGESELEAVEGGLGGVYSARAFVGWYNGLPEYAHLNPRLDRGDTAVILGQGNVALDVARVLLSSVDRLRETDMAEHALATLSKKTIRRVHVVGRRGPLQAAFTIKELRELLTLDGVRFAPIQHGFFPENTKSLPRAQRRIADLLIKHSTAAELQQREQYSDKSVSIGGQNRTWSLDFMRSPIAFYSSHNDSERLGRVEFAHTRFVPEDKASPFTADARVDLIPADEEKESAVTDHIDTCVAFRSIGYKSVALPGMEELGINFDARRGIVPNIGGRVITSTGEHVDGCYCTGWVKNGPAGVIATTMEDAFAVAETVIEDLADKTHSTDPSQSKGGWNAVKELLKSNPVVSWQDWLSIDAAEVKAGKDRGKPREKFTGIRQMLDVVR